MVSTNLAPVKHRSFALDLENLRQQYSSLLAQYKSAVHEYTQYMSHRASTEMVSVKGYAFNGTGSAGPSQEATTLQQCEARCAQLSTCSGATFVAQKCLLRTGDSPLVPSSNQSYAIVPKEKQLLTNMEDINRQLLDTNTEIMDKINELTPVYQQNISAGSQQTQELTDNYKALTDERDNIMSLLKQYETLESAENQTQIHVTQHYYSYILLTIVAIAVGALLVKLSFFSQSSSSATQYGGSVLGTNAYMVVWVLILTILGIHALYKYYP